jgi:hypothetical protein
MPLKSGRAGSQEAAGGEATDGAVMRV